MIKHCVVGTLAVDSRLRFKVVLVDGKSEHFITEKAHFTNSIHIKDLMGDDPRIFGMCEFTTHCIFIAFHPAYLMRVSGLDQIVDIIAHEWGHAIAWATGFQGQANTEVLANYLGCILRCHTDVIDLHTAIGKVFDAELLAIPCGSRRRHKYMGGR
jgi:hypothetical protein